MKISCLLKATVVISLSFFAATSVLADEKLESQMSEDISPFVQIYNKKSSDREKYRMDDAALHITLQRIDKPNSPLEGVMLVGNDMHHKHAGVRQYAMSDEQSNNGDSYIYYLELKVVPTRLTINKDTYLVRMDYTERNNKDRSIKSSSFLIKRGQVVTVEAGMIDGETAKNNATITFELQ